MSKAKHKPIPWRISREAGVIVCDWPEFGADSEAWVCIQSDEHKDSPSHIEPLWREHMAESAAHGAVNLSFGDMFDAIGGRYDKRRSADGVKPEHAGRDDYYDSIAQGVADALAPYARQYGLLGRGNHETSVIRHAGTDLTARLADKLRPHGFAGAVGGYVGYVELRFGGQSQLLWWSHGRRGSSPVTRGVINTNRRAVWLASPDIVVSGDSHDGWLVPIARERINGQKEKETFNQLHIQCPSYCRSTSDVGYVAENEMPPKPIGCWWLRFFRGPGGELRRECRVEA